MKTLDIIILESREFVCEYWGQGEASVAFYAPLTRIDGITWIHPAWSKEYTWSEITSRADRVWRISGSFWNPVGFRLIWHNIPESGAPIPALTAALQCETQSTAAQASSALSTEGGSRSPSAMEGSRP